MARSRYSTTVVLDGNHFGTWRNKALEGEIEPDILEDVKTVDHVLVRGERLDHLAARFLGDDGYYWVIALVNGILDPLDLTPGQKLKIPTDVKQVLDKLM